MGGPSLRSGENAPRVAIIELNRGCLADWILAPSLQTRLSRMIQPPPSPPATPNNIHTLIALLLMSEALF